MPECVYHILKPSDTRSSVDGTLVVPFIETAIARKSFSTRAVVTWNRIPPDIRNITNPQGFKRKLKQY